MQSHAYTGPTTPIKLDYSKLENFLKRQNWKEADQETFEIILKVAGREKDKFLSKSSLQNLPWPVIHHINQLWVMYSYGRFGFSAQKRIWEYLGGNQNANHDIIRDFCCKTGWCVKSTVWYVQDNWKSYSKLHFDINSPVGCLPSLVYRFETIQDGGLLDYSIRFDILIYLLSHPELPIS